MSGPKSASDWATVRLAHRHAIFHFVMDVFSGGASGCHKNACVDRKHVQEKISQLKQFTADREVRRADFGVAYHCILLSAAVAMPSADEPRAVLRDFFAAQPPAFNGTRH